MRNNVQVIPVQYRPEVILRFSEQKTLLLSGLLDKAASIAERAIVVTLIWERAMFCCSRTIPSIAERLSEATTWSSMRFSTTTISVSLLPRLHRISPQPKLFQQRDRHTVVCSYHLA
jgi:hypothetical protein